MKISSWLLVALIISAVGLNACVKDIKDIAISKDRQQTAKQKDRGQKWQNPASTSRWKSFETDSLHDPKGPAFDKLQRPEQALASLPSDVAGNYVDWVKALTAGHINPRTNIHEETKVNILDLDIYMDLRGSMPIVKFPHREHTMWLDCENCHEKIFKYKTGSTKMTMTDILNGKFCGQCHGAVSFPLTECGKCHSVSQKEFRKLKITNKMKVSNR